jgi:type II secretory pathway component PulF
MPRFAYTARDRAGQTVAADLEAPSRKDALRLLSARGFLVSAVTELASGPAGKKGVAKTAIKKVLCRPRF